MSWGKYSKRDFNWGSTGTTANVGPGSYEIRDISKVKHNYDTSFGGSKEKRNPFGQKIHRTPDPGAYNPDKPASKQSRPCSAFQSRSERTPFQINDGPSPVDHSQITSWASKSSRRPKSSIKKAPMPYSPNVGQGVDGYETLPDGSLRPILRDTHDQSYLGPGCYDPDIPKTNIGASLKYGRPQTCLIDREQKNVPGPGAYTPRTGNIKIQPNIREYHDERPLESPKGGNMAHGDLINYNKATSNFKSKVKRDLWAKPNDYPGPQKYASAESSARRAKSSARTPRSGFGSNAPRFKDAADDMPGPGDYEAKDVHWMKSPTSNLPRAIAKTQFYGTTSPGPGSYELDFSSFKLKSTDPSPQFHNTDSRRIYDINYDTPGPGAYSPKDISNVGAINKTYGKAKESRIGFLEIKKGPSPVDYNVREFRQQKRSSSVSRATRFENSPRNDVPGPGAYNVDHNHDGLIKRSFNSDLKKVNQ
ncbi:hypothetical protein TVAG_372730 [Trichomonas vaginalis G3]|uniref:H-SHIPPO 1 n=1 Tax=Trichomonas vaginalis (strain ATCC PRA-98 / G3) TaxID=412133 RepID=A2EZ15_TRIV3|nr:sperm-tail PG-rich domain-containing protein [Trichomonas vaginalis G3]EAY02127.1 hypothetical protein TVAG_372730 [Trichomonas vaginalis G3]KAI5532728.1 sperm-tail PG-rich domain-containing protein [Trichomonas vaginalis G3]|eukprot:XP_001330547.1 hypothetical protein [Trichomonas vaginalis G3]